MSVTNRVILILKTPIDIPGVQGAANIRSICCFPIIDNQSPLPGLGVDVGVDDSGRRYCVSLDNIAGYIYETTEAALDSYITQGIVDSQGFVDLTL